MEVVQSLIDQQPTIKTLSTFLLPLFLLIIFFLQKKIRSPKLNLPPSPPKLPIIGNLHQLGSRFHRSLHALSQKYGDGDLMFLQLGSNPTIVVSSAKAASQVMKTHDQAFSGRSRTKMMKRIFYDLKDTIFSPYDDHWRQMRSILVLHLLTNKRVRSFRQDRERELSAMIKKIRDSGSNGVNMSELFKSLTIDLMCGVAFGRKYREEEGCGGIEKFSDEASELVASGNVEDVLPWLGWINRFNGYNVKLNRLATGLDELLERIIAEHEAGDHVEEKGDGIDGGETVKDFVDLLLEVHHKEGNSKNLSISRESIKGVLADILLAGTHTGHVTMEFAFTEILKHPEVLQRLQRETHEIAGQRDYISEEDLDKLTYLKAVIKENFRLHPPLPAIFHRECIEDVKLNGYDISKGTQVIVNAWAIGRDPTSWKDPLSFIPDRFLGSSVDYKGQHFELLPFGGGRRGCPGISFAMVSVELTLANLVHQFDWTVSAEMEGKSLDVNEDSTYAPHKEYPLIIVATPKFIK